jgi:hypothetical protein
MIDYKGDVKAAACRLEHALNDDLELAIDRLLGYPEKTPTGEVIPSVSRTIEPYSESMLLPLHVLPEGKSGKVELIILDGAGIRTLQDMGVQIGSEIEMSRDGFSINESKVEISSALSSRILIRTQ